MAQNILVTEQIDAAADFLVEFDKVVPISVALWITTSDAESLYLYIAAQQPDVDKKNAYGEVLRILPPASNPWLDPFQIKVIDSTDRIAVDAIKIRDRYSAPIPTRYHGLSIGGLGIDEAYIYPPISAMKQVT